MRQNLANRIPKVKDAGDDYAFAFLRRDLLRQEGGANASLDTRDLCFAPRAHALAVFPVERIDAFVGDVLTIWSCLRVPSLPCEARKHATLKMYVGVPISWLCVYTPAALGVFCLARIVIWLRNADRELLDGELARQLRLTMFLVGALGVAFTGWGLALYPYGDAYARCHVAFFMSITLIGCVFCLMHMRAAALLLTGIVIIPFTVFFSSTGNSVLIAIALNVMLVAMGMIKILLTYYRDFANLVESQKDLLTKQLETELLNNENFRLATVDSLTGLPNRRRFFAELDHLVAKEAKDNGRFAIGAIDLDGFKQINDLYGHACGDRVLAEVAQRLASFSNSDVTIARLGGDEFGLLSATAADVHLKSLVLLFAKAFASHTSGQIRPSDYRAP